MIYLVAFVVLVLATARLTRLIYFDDITIPFRQWIDRKCGPNSFVSKMVWCPWCASVWVSIFTCALANNLLMHLIGWDPLTSTLIYLLLVPAVSYPAGWIVERETFKTSRGE